MKSPLVVLSIAGALLATAVYGQGRWLSGQARMATPEAFDGTFNFCRVMYRSQSFGRGGGSWSTDYPRADLNLSIRLSELTKTRVSLDSTGTPNHLVVRLMDDELFQCPFILMAAVGGAYFDEEEAARLRAYLLKGGFLWVDDFWGSQAWDNWEEQIVKALPPPEFSIADIPDGHAMYRTQFQLTGVPQIPAIGFWFRSGGGTSERGADSADVHARSISDAQGRIMVLMTHNTDISDSWEREGEDPSYFRHFSVGGYALAINVLLYTMSH